MKTNCLVAFLLLISFYAPAQNRAAYFDAFSQYYRCGNITISGNKLTVEALIKIKGTGPFYGGGSYNIVSKHYDPSNVNYALRVDHGEISTTTGFYYTQMHRPGFATDSTYHVAMTYDGSYLKFYVNGCLFTQTPASGNLITNNFITTIGQLAADPQTYNLEQYLGYIDEVRMWNVVRTQAEIKNNMHDLPAPTTQSGLLAYYKFEGNSINVQGNSAYNAVPVNTPALATQDDFITKVKPFSASLTQIPPACNRTDGSITVSAQGGKAPYQYSLDGSNYQSSNLFSSLGPGTYTVYVKSDGIGCSELLNGTLNSAASTVNIYNSDTTIYLGDNIQLNSISSTGVYTWTPGMSLSCSNCSDPIAAPQATTTYILNNGTASCARQDQVTVTVVPRPQTNSVQASFTAPDTVCVKNPVPITNTSVGASSYYWNFCVADITNTPPEGLNLGNPNGTLSVPVFMDYVQVNGNYYGFVVNLTPARLVRLDFGNSLLNAPVAVNLGNFGGIIPVNAEGIQMVFNEGKWYAIIVGGSLAGSTGPRILKVDFGANINNPTPTATNWGNIGGLTYPVDLHVFKENNNWFGFTVNAESNAITRFNFGPSFDVPPTGVNLGNIGNLNFPTGIFAINNKGNWHVFVTNAGGGGSSSPNSSLTRLDFGSSLLNTPTGVNLGSLNGKLSSPRDLYILNFCDQLIGFVTNYSSTSDITRLNFNYDLTATPGATSLGNIGNLNFPHSISRLFRVGPDLYGFVTNAYNNTITRLRFTGCTSASNPNSTAKYPAPVTYNTPGTYNINLTVDDGLPTQTSFCKQVVVLPEPQKSPVKNIYFCSGESIKIGSAIRHAKYTWSTGVATDSIVVSTPGTYWVESDRFGCSVRDSFMVSYKTTPDVVISNRDTTIYAGDYIQVRGTSANGIYSWSPATSLSCSNCSDPIAAPQATTTYVLNDGIGSCFSQDQVTVTVVPSPPSCSDLQISLGGTANERAVDVAKTENGELFVAGNSKSFGNGDEILVTKLKTDGSVLWARTYGGGRDELVRKISATADGGLLVIGQTKSFSNANGEILAFKIDASGAPVWHRKFGLGSTYGDLGMDIIETSDGGYALSGIINVVGGVADHVVIRLNSSADIVWSKRFNRGDGEDGGGILQRGDTLIVATDLQNGASDYHMQVMKLKMSDGGLILSKKLNPPSRGIFNPYLYRNPAGPGYFISGHTIDIVSYANMQHIVLKLDDNFNIVKTSLINVSPVTNDFVTGFYPLADGSFITTASNQVNSDGYTFRVGSDNSLVYGKKINKSSDVRLYRLSVVGQEVVAVGGIVQNGQEDYFITRFPVFGPSSSTCDVENVPATIGQPAYTTSDFTWPTVSSPAFVNIDAVISSNVVFLQRASLCTAALNPEFSFAQDACLPKQVTFNTALKGVKSFQWSFGDGQTGNTSSASVTYADYDIYPVKLLVQYESGCMDSVSKLVPVLQTFHPELIAQSDTTICLGDSVLLSSTTPVTAFCWKEGATSVDVTNTAIKVSPSVSTVYALNSSSLGANLITNGDFTNGNTGFSSSYTYASSGFNAGVYYVGSSITAWHSGMTPCTDHTTGGGKMLLVNGAQQQNVKVWSQTLSVTPNTNYAFSAWLQTITTINPAQLQFSINDQLLNTVFTANANSCVWDQFYATWNSGSSTTATISIVNMNQGYSGNDFALDDIFFGPVSMRTDTVKITVNPRPHINLGPDVTICKDSAFQLHGNTDAGATVNWTPALYLSDPSSASPSARPLQTVTYIAEAALVNGCTASDTLAIIVLEKPVLNLGSDAEICEGESVVLNGQGATATSFSWTPVSSLSDPASARPVATPAVSTIYTLTASNAGCAATASVQVNVKPLPTISMSEDTTVCANAAVQLYASGGTEYEWYPATGLSSASSATPIATVVSDSKYTVRVKGDNNCVATDSVQLSLLPRPEFRIAPSHASLCLGEKLELRASGADEYYWSPEAALPFPQADAIEVSPLTTTRYKVVLRNHACKVEDSLFTEVQVHPKPDARVIKSNDIDCSNFEARLTATGGEQYEWYPAEGLSNPRISNPVAVPSRTTTYQVKVTNGQGCSSIDSVTVKFDASGLERLYIPSAFTPNRDGKNDCFGVRHWGAVKDFSLSVYNRWGEKVFSTTNSSDCWDGRYKGVDQPAGVFVYLISGTTVCGEINKKGLVTLVR